MDLKIIESQNMLSELSELIEDYNKLKDNSLSPAPMVSDNELSYFYNEILQTSKKIIDNVFASKDIENYWINFKSKNLKYWKYMLEVNYKKTDLDKSIKKKLAKEFTEDINFIEKMTNRNLDYWYE